MIRKLPQKTQIMRPWSNSSVLPFIDSIAIAIAQGYMLSHNLLGRYRERLAGNGLGWLGLRAADDMAQGGDYHAYELPGGLLSLIGIAG